MQRHFLNILLFFPFHLFGQELPIQKVFYKNFTTANGLNQSTVQTIITDANGLLWIGTSAGTQLYDGYNFFSLTGKRTEALQTSNYLRFINDENKNIWSVHSNGIIKYDLKSGHFFNILKFENNHQFDASNIHLLSANSTNKIVVYVSGLGIYCVDTKSETIQFNKTLLPDVDKFKNVYPIKETNCSNQFIYFSTNIFNAGTVYKINLNDLNAIKIYEYQKDEKAVELTEDSILTCQNNNEKIYYNLKNKKETIIAQNSPLHFPKLYSTINDTIDIDKIFATDEACTLNPKNETLSGILVDKNNNKIILPENFTCKMKDDFNNYWLGTSSGGLMQFNLNRLKFDNIFDNKFPKNNFLRTILWDEEEQFFIATLLNAGITIYDKSGNVLKRSGDFNNAKLIAGKSKSVQSILKLAPKKYLLINQYYPFLTTLDLSKKTITDVSYLLKNMKSKGEALSFFISTCTVNKNLQYCMIDNKLYRISYFNQQISFQEVFTSDATIGGLFYHDSKIYIGNFGRFYVIDSSGKRTNTVNLDGDPNTLIKYFASDNEANIWIATNNGLYFWDKKKKPVKIQNLPEHFFYTLAVEKNAPFIWCSSNSGLFRINTTNKSFVQFTINDGLISNEFNTNSCKQLSDGTIYFGTPQGIVVVDPKKISNKTLAPTPTIEKIIDGKFILGMDTAINQIKSISLPFSENEINIQFASIDFSVPAENIYRYRFANRDNSWKELGNNHTLNFVLQPGKYVLEIQAGKQAGIFNTNSKLIEIIIIPPFYKTTWFLILMSLFFATIAFALGYLIKQFFDRKKIAELKLKMEFQKERERISKDLHDNIGAQATALFYGIENLEQPDNESIQSLKQNTQDIIQSLRETVWAMGKEQIFITDLSDRFKLFILKINKLFPRINFHIEEAIEINKSLTAEQGINILRILQEAINNALKHSSANNIYFVVKSKAHIFFQIKDDGMGLLSETKNPFSDGNGFNNMKERALISGFKLNIQNNINGIGVSVELENSANAL